MWPTTKLVSATYGSSAQKNVSALLIGQPSVGRSRADLRELRRAEGLKPHELGRRAFLSEASRLLEIEETECDAAAAVLVAERRVIAEDTDVGRCLFLPEMYEAEEQCAERLAILKTAPAVRTKQLLESIDLALGEFEAKTWINAIVQSIRAVKADKESLRLQNEFYERSKHPLDTPQ